MSGASTRIAMMLAAHRRRLLAHDSVARAGLTLLIAASLAGCGSAPAAPRVAPPRPAWFDAERADVLVVPRAWGDRVRLTLWFAVGTADASPPQAAAAVALVLAQRTRQAAAPAGAIATPTAVRLGVECTRADVARCLERAAHAVFRNELGAADLAAARDALWRARTAAADDAPARSEALAITALVPAAARDWAALGHGERDPELTLGALRSFHAALREAPRLVTLEGEGTEDELQRAVMAAGLPATSTKAGTEARTPAGTRRAAQSTAEPTHPESPAADFAAEPAVTAEAGERPWISVAAWTPDLPRAAWALEAVRARATRGVRGRAFAVPGGAMFTVGRALGPAPQAEDASLALLEEVALAAYDATHFAPDMPAPNDVTALAQHWVDVRRRGGRERTLDAGRLGVALITDTRFSDEARVRLEKKVRAHLDEIVARAREAFPGARDAAEEADARRLSLGGSTTARVTEEPHDADVALAVLFSADPRAQNSARTQSLRAASTELLRGGCGEAGAAALVRAGVRTEPVRTARAWGVIFSAPSTAWLPLADAALRCLRRGAHVDGALGPARLHALSRAASAPLEARWSADAIGDAERGSVLTAGDPEALEALTDPELLAWFRDALRTRPLRVIAVGHAPRDALARAIAMRLSLGGRGPGAFAAGNASPSDAARAAEAPKERATTRVNTPTDNGPRAAQWESADPSEMNVVLTYATEQELGARAATECTEGLRAAWVSSGFAVPWSQGGPLSRGAWGAVAVRMPTSLAPSLDELARRHAHAAEPAILPRAPAHDAHTRLAAELAALASADLAGGEPAVTPTPPEACRTLFERAPKAVLGRVQPSEPPSAGEATPSAHGRPRR